jgi:hypothetical protein
MGFGQSKRLARAGDHGTSGSGGVNGDGSSSARLAGADRLDRFGACDSPMRFRETLKRLEDARETRRIGGGIGPVSQLPSSRG